MKKILCFGDSNTYGFIPGKGDRYDKNTRWTGILENLSNEKFLIEEAGCNNRTCFCQNDSEMTTGHKILPKYLKEDLDLVILAVGVNDLQLFFRPENEQIKNGIENLIDIVRLKLPKIPILILSPSTITEDVLNGIFAYQFDKISIEKSKVIGEIYFKVAKEKNCLFLDLDKIVKVSPKDGLHYEPEQHKIIAQKVFEILEEEFIKSSIVTF